MHDHHLIIDFTIYWVVLHNRFTELLSQPFLRKHFAGHFSFIHPMLLVAQQQLQLHNPIPEVLLNCYNA